MVIKKRIDVLEQYLNKLYKNDVFPGAVFSLIDSESTYINYLGKSQLTPEVEDVKEDTLYDLASLTKVVATTSAIMMLVERGHITLDTPVSDILTRYKNSGITIRHLMLHMSGHDADIDCRKMNRQGLIDSIYNSKIDPNRFEREVVYSDIGYILLGFIVEEITGSFEGFVVENLFKPLNMDETFFNPSEDYVKRCAATEFCSMRDRLIKGIVHDEKCYLLGGATGHAGLFSTAKDLSNFVRMYLDDGEFDGKAILNKQTIETMAKCYTDGTGSERGLGWMIKGKNNVLCDFASDKTIYHSGFTGTSIIMDLGNKKGFILLSNRVHPSRENIKLIPLRRKIHNVAFSAIK